MKTPKARESESEAEPTVKNDSDICQQLMSRYSTSKAIHHRHLLATAAAIRSLLSPDACYPPSPAAYFAASINNLSTSETLDSTAIAALLSFISILVPLIPEKEIDSDKASEAVNVLVSVVEREELGLGAASVVCVVKCVGNLIVRFCDLEDWSSLKLGFHTLIRFCVDKRPKVRKGAQDWLEKVFKSLGSSSSLTVIKKSSKLVFSILESNMANALVLSELKIVDGSKDETLSTPGNLEVLQMLNLLKLVVPYLSVKISSKVLLELLKLIRPLFYPLTRHIFNGIEAFLETSREEVIAPHLENIVNSLCLYVSTGNKNPADTLISAATLLEVALEKLHTAGSRTMWMRNVPKVFGSVAGLLICEATTASQASDITKKMINHCLNQKRLLTDENQSFEDLSQESETADLIKSTCAVFDNTLGSCTGMPNEHLLEIISVLFLKLREASFIFMKNLVLKLANLMNSISQEDSELNHLQNCIGSAVVAMGPERILTLIPISVHTDNLACSNLWLEPILKKHVAGASLGYYMEHIVPLAESFMQASKKVKQSVIGQDLQACAYGLWGLLPAFCQYPVDTHKRFGSLVELLITFLKKDSFMHQHVAVAIQALVDQNRSAVTTQSTAGESHNIAVNDTFSEFRSSFSYSKKIATRNMKALQSCSIELLQALVYLFADSLPEKRLYIKDAIRCLASITDSSITKNILMSLLERFQLVNDRGEFEQLMVHGDEMIETEQGSLSANEQDEKRCVVMELASSLIQGAKEDLINLIYSYVVYVFKDTAVTAHCEAYHTLNRILEEHAWFCSSRFMELIDFLIDLKPPADAASLRNRFACFHILMIHALEISLEEENTKAFLMLNEIILALKDANDDEARKVAYDTLLMISSSLRNSSHADSGEPYHKLISMMMGYLSGPSPHIKSGAVSALSLLVYSDADICFKMPDLVPSLLSLLQSKAIEVIKAVLGFVKVLVSSLQPKDLQNLLSDITSGILLWSTVSRFHFRSKVTVILEIMIRKCGSAAVDLVTPEKYKTFVKTVLQNRHHKSTSKTSGSRDTEIKPSDSSGKRIGKRKHKELGSYEKGLVHQKKTKRQIKENKNPPATAEPHISGGNRPEGAKRDDHPKYKKPSGGPQGAKGDRRSKFEKPLKGQSVDNDAKKGKYNKEPTGGGKKKFERRSNNKKSGTVFHKSGSASKLYKHSRSAKQQKS